MDLEELHNNAHTVHEQFCNGQFVLHKTRNRFSALAIDQAHKQNTVPIKADDGAIGLLQDPSMLNRWKLAGPHISTILQEYEDENS
ncbi:hypothetical protein BC332_34884 [Capsicum chinense]|nr:hypothetical protein BC332_34884 [Capsicum chinense]